MFLILLPAGKGITCPALCYWLKLLYGAVAACAKPALPRTRGKLLPPSAVSASAFFAQKLANAGHVVGLFIVGTRLTTLFFSQHQLDVLSIIQEVNDNTREVI